MPRRVYIDYSKYWKAKLLKRRRKYYKRRDKVWRAIGFANVARGLTRVARSYAGSSYFPKTGAFRNELNLWKRQHLDPSVFGVNPYKDLRTYKKQRLDAYEKLLNKEISWAQYEKIRKHTLAMQKASAKYEAQRKIADEEYFKEDRTNKKIDDIAKWADLGVGIGTALVQLGVGASA